MKNRAFLCCCLMLTVSVPARAGLYHSGEPIAELPSQWRGFLPDQRALRLLSARPAPNAPAHPLRGAYRDAADALTKLAAQRPLTADEAADLGALHIRLGAVDAAVSLLRNARQQYPDHFRVAANLGTAWQMQGDLDQAAQVLREAVQLAPPRQRKAEELHLKLVTLRRGQPRDALAIDDLFGTRFVGEKGVYTPGTIADAERAKLPGDAVAVVQQLALWLPGDGRLLWQLGELANAYGDVRTAAAILDGCVSELGMGDQELRRRRSILRTAADELAKQAPAGRGGDAQNAHNVHAASLTFRSPRPLARRLDAALLPTVRPDGVNPLPWAVLNATTIDRQAHPTFHKHLRQIDGLKVSLTGFLQPIGDALDSDLFLLIEFPVGCWFCEVPEPTGIVLIELPAGKTAALTRTQVKVTGRLVLNDSDPEHFLYTVRDAVIGQPD
jgi:thioredoxin-like negative regulator of GroEL